MLIGFKRGQTSILLRVKILNSSVSTGVGLTGLTSASSGLKISTIADNEATATAYTVAASNVETVSTLGTFAAPTSGKCRFREVDATNHPGVYEIQIANARFAVSSAKSLLISITGATNAADCDVVIPLRDLDPYDSIRAGLTALPNANANANGGLPILSVSGTTLNYTIATLTTYTGNTPQTGDAFLRLGVNGAGLTALATSVHVTSILTAVGSPMQAGTSVVLATSQPNYAPAKAGDAMTLTIAYEAAKSAAPANTALSNLVWTNAKAAFIDAAISSASAPTVEEIDAYLSTQHGDTPWGAAVLYVTPLTVTVGLGEASDMGNLVAYFHGPMPAGPITITDALGSPVNMTAMTLTLIGRLTTDHTVLFVLTSAAEQLVAGGVGGNQLTIASGIDYADQAGQYELFLQNQSDNGRMLAVGGLTIHDAPELPV